MAEIDTHWREFVHSLEGLSSQMHGPQDLEQVLLGAHTLIHDAVGHAQKNGPRLSAQVRRGHLVPNWEGREALIEKNPYWVAKNSQIRSFSTFQNTSSHLCPS